MRGWSFDSIEWGGQGRSVMTSLGASPRPLLTFTEEVAGDP